MTKLVQDSGIYVLHLGDDENRFTLDWLDQVNTHLDQVVTAPAPLVTTGSRSSTPMDLTSDGCSRTATAWRSTWGWWRHSLRGCSRCRFRPSLQSQDTRSAPARCSPWRTTGA